MRSLFIFLTASFLLIGCSKEESLQSEFNDVNALENAIKSTGHNAPCPDFVFPVRVIYPDRTSAVVNTKLQLRRAFQAWTGSGQRGEPTLDFPVQMTFRGQTYVLNNMRELKRIQAGCTNGNTR